MYDAIFSEHASEDAASQQLLGLSHDSIRANINCVFQIEFTQSIQFQLGYIKNQNLKDLFIYLTIWIRSVLFYAAPAFYCNAWWDIERRYAVYRDRRAKSEKGVNLIWNIFETRGAEPIRTFRESFWKPLQARMGLQPSSAPLVSPGERFYFC